MRTPRLFPGAMQGGLLMIMASVLLDCSPVIHRWTGKVVEVRSGDTLTVLNGRRQVQVRLHGVGVPTVRRPAGISARAMVSRLVLGKEVSVSEVSRDRRGRSYAIVKIGTLGLRELLLYTGLAWHIIKYDDSPSLRNLERDAQRARRGVWAEM